MIRHSVWFAVAMLLVLVGAPLASAQRSWDGGNATFVWGDFGNWSPDGDPNGETISIGNLAAAANDRTLVDAAYSIDSLIMSNGADVINSTDNGATTEFELAVNGATTLSGVGTSITIYGGVPDGLDTNTLVLLAGGTLNLNSQEAVGTAVVEVDGGQLTNNVGGTVFGNGRIDLEDAPGVVTALLNNEGTLSAGYVGAIIFTPATTLQITATSANARVDLDGVNANNGVVNVNRNATLDIDVPVNDAFSGDLNLSDGATLNIAGAWSIDGGTVDVNTPAILGGPAAHLAGGAITMSGGTLTLNDGLDGLIIDAAMTGTGGVINNSGTITVNAVTTFLAAVDFNMLGGDSKLVVNSTLNIDTPDFNLDGTGSAGNVTTINAGGNLDLDLGAGADEDFQHTINMNGGELDVTTADNSWSLNIGGVINAGGAATSNINGETFLLAGTGSVNVAAGSQLNVNATTEITGSLTFNIAATGVLNFGTVTYANAAATYTGDGTLLKGAAMVNAATTWNVAVVDLDDGATTLNADLTINADSIDSSGDGVDAMITISDDAHLTVNITGGGGWTLDPGGTITYNGDAQINHYLAGSDVAVNGTINHSGDGRIQARLDVGASGVLNILAAGLPLILGGGDTTSPNTIAGGTVNGPGPLGCDLDSALHGFGTINADVSFHGILKADNGILNLNGAVAFDGILGTAHSDGILNVANAWNMNQTSTVELQGGELRGAAITNDGVNGINGFGLLSAPVINNTRIDAEGGTLIVETAANDNDWDGAGNAGQLNAVSGNLEVRDTGIFSFFGTVSATSGRTVFVNGFNLDFNPGSTLSLTAATYKSNDFVRFDGSVIINAGASSDIDTEFAEVADFFTASTTTLNGSLEFSTIATFVRAGATFGGGGSLIALEGSGFDLANSAVVDVLVETRGFFSIHGSVVGRADVRDYQQTATGEFKVDLDGTALNQFDRLVVSGAAQLAGSIDIHLVAGLYVPVLGDTFDILSASGGVIGSFAEVVQPINLPAGLIFDVIYSPTLVQLMVVDALPGDYNHDGTVDAADYVVWRKTDGTQTGYDTWRMHFGETLGNGAAAGSSSNTTVPEPAASVMLFMGMVALWLRRRAAVS